MPFDAPSDEYLDKDIKSYLLKSDVSDWTKEVIWNALADEIQANGRMPYTLNDVVVRMNEVTTTLMECYNWYMRQL